MKHFFELIQVALGNREQLTAALSSKEWGQLYSLANKQSLVSFLIDGLNKLPESQRNLGQSLLLEWIGSGLQTENYNRLQNERSKELYERFKKAGYRSCILKGQGTATYYEHPEHRQCGDIDIWVDGERDEILKYITERELVTDGIDVQHTNVQFFSDVEVEVHFLPSFMYSPVNNGKLQRFFAEKTEEQFKNYDSHLGYARTTVDFDLVFSLVHIYRHVFSEGIGMRQLIDYYHILIHSDDKQRTDAIKVLDTLGMTRFAGGIMWILRECFGMKESFQLCPENADYGKFLLSEIMIAGNFGHYDTRVKKIDSHKRLKRGFSQFRKNLRFMQYYPSEVLWSPFWKLWHWCWRKWKGYL